MKTTISKESQEQAMKIAKGTQRKGQTKEQTKLISQGIEKGIADYKKQQNKKKRERDKLRKTKLKASKQVNDENTSVDHSGNTHSNLPWGLLVLSWLAFFGYYFITL